MRDRETTSWREVRTGLLLLAALAALALAVFFSDAIRREVEEGPRLLVVAREAPGIAPGSSVWVAGHPSGRVTSVEFLSPRLAERGDVLIQAVLQRDVVGAIRADATASVEPSALLAPEVLAIDPGSPSAPPFDFADTLRTEETEMRAEEVMALGDSLLVLLRDLRPLGERLRAELREGGGTLPALGRNPETMEAVDRRLERLSDILARLDRGEGSAGRLLADTALPVHVRRLRARLDSLGALLERRAFTAGGGRGPAEAVGSPPSLATALERLARRTAALDSLLETGAGTAGQLLHDDAIARETRLLRSRLDSLRVDLARRPLRWFRLRIF